MTLIAAIITGMLGWYNLELGWNEGDRMKGSSYTPPAWSTAFTVVSGLFTAVMWIMVLEASQ